MRQISAGFTLIESIVALVLLSLTFSVVWGWFGTATITTEKIKRATALPDIYEQFSQRLAVENLQDNRQGQYIIDEFTVEWSASVERQSTERTIRRQPAWVVTLFVIEGRVLQGGELVTSFQSGAYRQWRDPNYFDPSELGG